jgi:glycosyltransferase involved in cell wall biosynthesis
MRVLIDGYNFGIDKGTGVATYGRNLSRVVSSLGHDVVVCYGAKWKAPKSEFLREVAFFDAVQPKVDGYPQALGLFVDGVSASLGCAATLIPISGNVNFDSVKARLPHFDELWNSRDLYRRAMRSFRWVGRFASLQIPEIDVAHWTYPLPIFTPGAKNIYTLHDLVPLKLPQTTLDNKKIYYRLCMALASRADHIVTVSETSRRDIVEILGVSPDKVTNTYQAVEFPEAALKKTEAELRNELTGIFGLHWKGYFLFYGAIEPKKNIGRIVEAYLSSTVCCPLVVVGAPGWKSEEELRLLEAVKELPTADGNQRRIIRIEYLPLPLLMTVIRGAKATIFASLYEGFGLPVLESMVLRTAVITSNTSSLPEVAGDAALLVDPLSVSELVHAIRAIDSDEYLRMSLENKGVIRSRVFSKEKYAERINDVYAHI